MFLESYWKKEGGLQFLHRGEFGQERVCQTGDTAASTQEEGGDKRGSIGQSKTAKRTEVR